MGTEDLDQTNLEGWNFAVHEDTRQVKLDLETDVDIGSIDRGTPPEGEATIGDLVETRTLSVGEFLVPHRLFKSGRLLPEQTLPCGEVGALEQGVLENTLNTT